MRKRFFNRILKLTIIFNLLILAALLAQNPVQEKLTALAEDSENPLKCGFPVVLEAAASQAGAAFLKQRRAEQIQQNYQTYLSPSGRFLIHYQTGGADAIPAYDRNGNGVPDYLEFVAKSFDRAWEVEIDSLGFDIPPDSAGAAHTQYPVYCKKINAYGITWFANPLPGYPQGYYRFDSYIEINTDFSFVTYPDITNDPIVRDSLAIAVTAAHEFNHALQLGYRLWFINNNYPDLWFIESSATYMEEVVAPQVNDYFYYLDCIFNSTDIHLTGDNNCNRIYGEAVLHIMLGELYGKEITREVWAEIVNQQAVQSLNLILLEQKGSSLNKEMQRWATWMFFSGSNALPGEFYPEADNYPTPGLIELNPVNLTQNPNAQVYEDRLPSLSFQWLKIPVVATDEVFILIDPEQNSGSWYGAQLDVTEPYEIQFDANIPYPANFTPPSGDIYLAVTSGDWDMDNTASPTGFTIELQATGNILGEDVLVGPNPVKVGEGDAVVTFLNLPREPVIEIFSGNGVRVATVEPREGAPVAQWNLRNFRNDLVGSGVYIYRIVSPEKSVSGKIMVIR